MQIFGNRANNSCIARPIAPSSETKCEISESRLWDRLACTPQSVAYSKIECLRPPSEVLRHQEAKTKTGDPGPSYLELVRAGLQRDEEVGHFVDGRPDGLTRRRR